MEIRNCCHRESFFSQVEESERIKFFCSLAAQSDRFLFSCNDNSACSGRAKDGETFLNCFILSSFSIRKKEIPRKEGYRKRQTCWMERCIIWLDGNLRSDPKSSEFYSQILNKCLLIPIETHREE